MTKKDYQIIKSSPRPLAYESFDLKEESLDAKTILRTRSRYYEKDAFFNTTSYDKIREKILNNNTTLIIGNPLAGKTRIVFETLASLKSGLVIFPLPYKWVSQYQLPHRKDIILFIDELDTFCENNPEAINHLLHFAFNNDLKCIFTCRTGPELTKVKNVLYHQLWTELISNRIRLPRISSNDSRLKEFIFTNSSFIKDVSHFDGNIGSLFIPLEDMRRRYQNLLENKKDHSIAILKGLKFHYQLFNYESTKSQYDENKIRIFCDKSLNEELTDAEWEDAKREIISTDTTLNFIDEDENENNLIIEEVYLDCHDDQSNDVIDETFTRYKIIKKLQELYKDLDEKRALGFPTNINDWNTVINKHENFNEAYKVFKQIPDNVKKNSFTFESLIKKTDDKKIRKELFDELNRSGLDPRNMPNSTYFGKFDDFKELLEAISETSKGHLKFKTNVSAKLIKLAQDNPKRSLEILFNKYPKDHIFGNYVFIEICIKCCKDLDDYKKYVEPYLPKAPKLETNLFKSFIRLCLILKQRRVALEFLENYFSEEKYDYYNQKANCLREEQPEDALELYLLAANSTDRNKLIAIAYNNFGYLVYEKRMQKKVHDGISYCFKAIKTTKILHSEFPFLRYTLLLLIIWQTPIENLIYRVELLLNRPDIKKATVCHVIPNIFDEEKQKLLKDYFFTSKEK